MATKRGLIWPPCKSVVIDLVALRARSRTISDAWRASLRGRRVPVTRFMVLLLAPATLPMQQAGSIPQFVVVERLLRPFDPLQQVLVQPHLPGSR